MTRMQKLIKQLRFEIDSAALTLNFIQDLVQEKDNDEQVDEPGIIWLTTQEAAKMLNVEQQTIYQLIHKSGLPACRIGKKTLRIDAIKLKAWAVDQASKPYIPRRQKAEER